MSVTSLKEYGRHQLVERLKQSDFPLRSSGDGRTHLLDTRKLSDDERRKLDEIVNEAVDSDTPETVVKDEDDDCVVVPLQEIKKRSRVDVATQIQYKRIATGGSDYVRIHLEKSLDMTSIWKVKKMPVSKSCVITKGSKAINVIISHRDRSALTRLVKNCGWNPALVDIPEPVPENETISHRDRATLTKLIKKCGWSTTVVDPHASENVFDECELFGD